MSTILIMIVSCILPLSCKTRQRHQCLMMITYNSLLTSGGALAAAAEVRRSSFSSRNPSCCFASCTGIRKPSSFYRHTLPPLGKKSSRRTAPAREALLFSSSTSLLSSDFGNRTSTSTSQSNFVFNDKSDTNQGTDLWHEFYNVNNIRDQVVSVISGDGGIKVTAATVRNLVNDLMIKQTLTPISCDGLSRTVTCALLMANGIQAEQMVQITINGDGPIRGVVAISTGLGAVKGYVGTPMLGDMTITEAIGRGSVQVVKNHPDWPRPYNGITAIRHGDIDRDIGIYLAESEQRSCALAAATSIPATTEEGNQPSKSLLCTAAGGYLIEQLPNVEPDVVKQVEINLAKLVEMDGTGQLPTGLLMKGITPLGMAQFILDGLDMKPLQQIEPKLVCDCTEDRLLRALRLLSRDDVEDILAKEDRVEARCHFCGKIYRMEATELRTRLDRAVGDPAKD